MSHSGRVLYFCMTSRTGGPIRGAAEGRGGDYALSSGTRTHPDQYRTYLDIVKDTVPEPPPSPARIALQQPLDLCGPFPLCFRPRSEALDDHFVDISYGAFDGGLRVVQGGVDPREGLGREKVVIDRYTLRSPAACVSHSWIPQEEEKGASESNRGEDQRTKSRLRTWWYHPLGTQMTCPGYID